MAHGVSFKEASSVFDDDDALIVDDINHSFNEDRFLIIGKSYMDRVLYVCFCERYGDVIRLISARKADKERKRNIMHTLNQFDDPLNKKIRVDWSTAKKNPYAVKITPEQRVKMMIEVAFEKSNMTKEQFKKEVDLILA